MMNPDETAVEATKPDLVAPGLARPEPERTSGDIGRPNGAHVKPDWASLDHLRTLTHGWDSYDAKPISDVAIARTDLILSAIYDVYGPAAGELVVPDFVGPVADGGVYVEWRTSTGEVAVRIRPNGSLNCFAVTVAPDGEDIWEADDVPLPKVLATFARVIACP